MTEYKGMSQDMWPWRIAGSTRNSADIWTLRNWYRSVLLWFWGSFAPFSSFCSPAFSASVCTRQKMVMLSPVDMTLQIKCPTPQTLSWYPYCKLSISNHLGMAFDLCSLVSQTHSVLPFGAREERVTWYHKLGKIGFLGGSVRAQQKNGLEFPC